MGTAVGDDLINVGERNTCSVFKSRLTFVFLGTSKIPDLLFSRSNEEEEKMQYLYIENRCLCRWNHIQSNRYLENYCSIGCRKWEIIRLECDTSRKEEGWWDSAWKVSKKNRWVKWWMWRWKFWGVAAKVYTEEWNSTMWTCLPHLYSWDSDLSPVLRVELKAWGQRTCHNQQGDISNSK